MAEEIFNCQQCGQCCKGSGGIVLQPHDLHRLAAWLHLPESEVTARWAISALGKLKLKTGDDGYCIFFSHAEGCSVHEVKPDVCRAWPFFRGNLEDETSFAMAREYCPGINSNATFAEFRSQGLKYIIKNNLSASGTSDSPNALMVEHLIKNQKG